MKYSNMVDLFADPDLLDTARVAVVIAARNIMAANNSETKASERKWAKVVLFNELGEAQKALKYILAGLIGLSKQAAKSEVSDANMQAAVDEVVPVLIKAMSAQ